MEGTYRKKEEEPPPPAYEDLYKPSNGGFDNVGVVFHPEDVNGHAGPAKRDDQDQTDEDKKKEKKKDEKEKPPMVAFTKLFHYADGKDKFLLFLAVFGAIAHGAATPVQFIIFGRLVENLINFEIPGKKPNLEDVMEELAIYYIYLAVGTLIVAYLHTGLFSLTAVRQTKKMRTAFFNSVMRQNIGWFDTYEAGELNSRLTEDINKVAEGIGAKVGMAIQFTVTFFAGFTIGFVYSWELTLVILSLTPLMIIAGGIMGKVISVFTSKELDAYAKAGAIAEEVLSSIRTVAAFGGEEKEQKRYASNLGEARSYGIKKGLSIGLGFGFFQLIMFGSYALAFWYGSTLVVKGKLTGGDLLVVFFSVLVGATQLGQAGPNMEAIATARGAAHELYAIIEREPPIDVSSEEGEKPDDVVGEIEFKDINFYYPSRPDVKVLNGLNLSVGKGQTVALVGESGCGKSTTVKLIQRFYDPESGTVLMDNKDIKTLNLHWLRQHIGVVSQEPVLFATTIAENIRYGQDGISQEDIEKATKMSNAHDFIQNLPQGYETLVGERGAQLSGGQKQRIAIARALVRNPKILLLDEATSALDTESEAVVQAALDKAREGRTTIVIAHRLSTVRNADQIAAFQDGVIAELGTHSELMAVDGVYKQLVTLQTFESDQNGDDDEADIEKSTEEKEIGAAVKFVRSLSDESDHEPSKLERQLSKRASRRLSKHRPGSALSRQDSHVGSEKKEKVIEEDVEPAPVLRIMKLNTPEWPYMVFGTIGAIGNGLLPVVFALILGEILNVFTIEDTDALKEKALFWSMMFLAFGAATFFTQLFQNYMFAYSGELLTVRLRDMAFKAVLRQEMAFFDDPHHSTGALTTALATHASDVKGATGSRLGTIAMTITTVISSLVYAFINGWKLTLLVLAFIPFIAVAGALQIKTFVGDDKSKDELLESGKVAVEAFENVRTIATLGKEKTFCAAFHSTLLKPYKKAVRSAHFYGISYGLMESIMFLCNAASFRFGAFLMVQDEMTMMEVMKVVMCIVIMGMMFGHASGFSPDYVKAKIAAARLFKLFDRVPLIDSSSDLGLTPASVQGTVQLRSVRFRYPTRPDVKVLRGINLEVGKGQTVALVGSSGCGKSTIVSLLERFYDVEDGEVSLDGANVQTLNIKWLRSKLGIVSQEPVLFGFSIAENIAYGDNSREVSMAEIEAAARASNIHSFINSLPKGYDTLVGDKGTLISGGQKQRIAIARALIRNPQILLLDEATSALDTESERVVQDALDAASEGRTVIVIAHRLSTVKNADKIAVIHHGRVAEEGTHQELIALNGLYAGLVSAQMVNENS